MWWLGSIRANWVQVFGPKTWTWLRTSCLFLISFVRYMTLLTIKRLKQSRLGRPRNKDWSTLGIRALMRTGCGCLANSGRQTCDSCATFSGMMVMMITIFLWIYIVRLYTHGKIGCIHSTLSYVDTYSCSLYPLDSGLYLSEEYMGARTLPLASGSEPAVCFTLR